jgi:hypothetical protein
MISTLGSSQLGIVTLVNTYMFNVDDMLMLRNALILLKQGIVDHRCGAFRASCQDFRVDQSTCSGKLTILFN